MRRPTILVVDDDVTYCGTFGLVLRNRCQVLVAHSAEQALGVLGKRQVDIVFLDLNMPGGMGGLDALPIIRERFDCVDVVITTVEKDVRTVVQAMKLGATDYMTKDFEPEEIAGLIERILEKRRKEMQLRYLESEVSEHEKMGFVMGSSPAMREVYDIVQRVAGLPTTVLITGESGTGKEVLARMIHQIGGRPDAPFVAVNLLAIPEQLMESTLFGHEKGGFTGALQTRHGKFELANGGTILLDEVGDLSYEMQGKLLRVLQEGEIERVGGSHTIQVDVRVLAATRTDLESEMKQGKFREDLYYRLNVVRIRLPSLRERPEEIEPLARAFVARFQQKFGRPIDGIAPEALESLCSYPWPGNIRELENLLERCVALRRQGPIGLVDLPIEFHIQGPRAPTGSLQDAGNLARACEAFERNFIVKSLERCRWSRKRTAQYLGLPLSTLKYKLDRLKIREVLEDENR